MLLPSAMSFEPSDSSIPKPFYPSTTLFASPPISPPATSHSHTAPNTNTAISSIYSTCRALQSMLSPSLSPSPLPSPPVQHMNTPLISSPFKLRLRNRGIKADDAHLPRKKITKRAPSNTTAPPRGVNKRRRALDDESSRASIEQSPEPCTEEENEEKENILTFAQESREEGEQTPAGPRTPKRLRLAPEVLPFGLERSDFHALHLQHQISSQPLLFPSSSSSQAFPYHQPRSQTQNQNNNQEQEQQDEQDEQDEEEEEEEEEQWTTEDDRLLVELVLEKLKLSKSEWQDCARSLGRDRGSVGKRWKNLMMSGDVGLKARSRGAGVNTSTTGIGRRRAIYGSWR